GRKQECPQLSTGTASNKQERARRFSFTVTSCSAVPGATSPSSGGPRAREGKHAQSAFRNFRLDNSLVGSQTNGRYEELIWNAPTYCLRRNRHSCGRQLLRISIYPEHRIVLCRDWT